MRTFVINYYGQGSDVSIQCEEEAKCFTIDDGFVLFYADLHHTDLVAAFNIDFVVSVHCKETD